MRKRVSGFDQLSASRQPLTALHEEIRELYLADDAPWILGYSGGKDSTATLQLDLGNDSKDPPRRTGRRASACDLD
jgi:3'-phosphoadenosine 5'-phosphosulfate sulfotransferase (PAPS reductase)/FAD synthetase